jgi:hypothetical protein
MAAPEDGDIRDVLNGLLQAHHIPLQDTLEGISTRSIGVYRRWAPRVCRFSFHLPGQLSDDGVADDAQT